MMMHDDVTIWLAKGRNTESQNYGAKRAASYARAMAAGPSFEGYYSNANPEHVNKVWAAAANPKA